MSVHTFFLYWVIWCVFFFFFAFESSLYILDIKYIGMCFAEIHQLVSDCLSSFNSIFQKAEFFILVKSNLSFSLL